MSQDEVLAIGGVNGHSSLLFLDAATVRERLKANPWIAEATVLKFYPGQLQIDIVERSAFALWQQDGRISVISDDGAVLEPYLPRRFVSLPLVVGKGAETHARDFLALLASAPGRAFTRAEIMRHLWRSTFTGDDRACDTHVVNLRRPEAFGGALVPFLAESRPADPLP